MAKIILAEDDNDMRRFLVKALQNAGFDVISFDNGLSAYQRLREEPFELLLTDIVMPEMTGRELAETLLDREPDLKVLYISGYTDDEVLQRGVRGREVPLVRKPFATEELVRRVRNVLDGR